MNISERKISLPFYGLILFFALQLFTPQLYIPILQKIKFHYIIFIVTFLSAIIAKGISFKSKQTFLLISILVLMVVSIIASPIPYIKRESWIGPLTSFIQAMALFFLVTLIIDSEEGISRFCHILVFFSFIIGFVSLTTFRLGISPIVVQRKLFIERLTNYFGGFGNDPNFLSLFFVLVLPLSLLFAQASRSYFKKASLIFVSIVFLLCIFESKSRGGLIGLTVVALILLRESKNKIKSIILILAVTILAALFVTPEFWERTSTMKSIESIQQTTAHSRLTQYSYAIELISLHPLSGVGLGNFTEGKEYTLGLNPDFRETRLTTHNSYLQIGAEIGLPGLFLFLIMLAFTYKDFVFANKIGKDIHIPGSLHIIVKGLKTGYIGFLFGLFFISSQYNLILYLGIGLAVSSKRIISQIQK